ncbi:MAG: hypothetical protein PHE67_06100 [Campylobacterales bacterium]|nr:hypothetical protein [Campylobacterales bacterium]
MKNKTTYDFSLVLLDGGVLCIMVALSMYSLVPFVYKKGILGGRAALIQEAKNMGIAVADVSTNIPCSIALTNTYAKVAIGGYVEEELYCIIANSIIGNSRKTKFTAKLQQALEGGVQ